MKDIKNYEGLYAISEDGQIWSYRNNKFLKQTPNYKGYLYVSLCKNGSQHNVRVNRLVAEYYLPNPDNFPCVNHKDEDKTNNSVNNLEWCSYEYNNNYGTHPLTAYGR